MTNQSSHLWACVIDQAPCTWHIWCYSVLMRLWWQKVSYEPHCTPSGQGNEREWVTSQQPRAHRAGLRFQAPVFFSRIWPLNHHLGLKKRTASLGTALHNFQNHEGGKQPTLVRDKFKQSLKSGESSIIWEHMEEKVFFSLGTAGWGLSKG